ncbi:MAG: cyclase family protein [Balneolaceae bacterium]|nr:cyclase family protein [Balneolaceae bacterium]
MSRVSHLITVAMIVALFSLSPYAALSQDRQSGPWWPHPEWGADDQAGASNRITPRKVLDAMRLVTEGQIYELDQLYEQGMPLFGSRSYSMVLPAKGSAAGANRLIGNEEFLSTQIGQVGTQFDGLGHIGREIEMESGETRQVFYNGYTAGEMDTPSGLQKLGIEQVRPIITRGILVDVAGYKETDRLPNSYEVTVDDLLGALERQGLSGDEIEPGDALLFRYGWSSLWDRPEAYNTNPPGIGLEVARWLAEKKVTMIGSDSWCSEVVPNPDPNLAFPVHQELLMKNGIFNLENMRLEELAADEVTEFLFILTPIRFKGATGSPVRPVAIR